MHWFWRASIAIAVGGIYGALSVTVFGDIHEMVADFIRDELFGNSGLGTGIGVSVGWFIPLFCLVLTVYALLTRIWGPTPYDRETRCRKCHYILRGITEPRCPECGERI
jgi:hypothetical protein